MPRFSRISFNLLVALLSFQLVSCGTLLYPERKGQKGGRVDPGVAVLDAIGLLFFLIPGIVAFAIDFNNGTIYLPNTAKTDSEPNAIRTVQFDKDNYSPALLRDIILMETGCAINLSDQRLQTVELESVSQIPVYFSKFRGPAPVPLTIAAAR